jgi:hypothetical protein
MKWQGMAVAAAIVAATALPSASAIAYADPVAPQADSACPLDVANAMTFTPDGQTPLICQPAAGYRWQPLASPFNPSSRWFSYGRELRLHGEGLRNPEIRSGDWMAVPQDADSQCTAEQVAVVYAGVVTPPQVSAGAKGQQLSFQVLPKLFSIKLSGNCLWTKAGA